MNSPPWLVETRVPLAGAPASASSTTNVLVVPPLAHEGRKSPPPLLYMAQEQLPAPASSVYFFKYAPRSLVHWRLLPGRCGIELRRIFLASSQQKHHHHQNQHSHDGLPDASLSGRPVEIRLPEPVIGEPAFFEDARTWSLHLMAVTVSGSFHRIVFPMPDLFYTDPKLLSLANNVRCFRPAIFASLATRVPVSVHFPDLDTVIVGCGNGSLIHIDCRAIAPGPPADGVYGAHEKPPNVNDSSDDEDDDDDDIIDDDDDDDSDSTDQGDFGRANTSRRSRRSGNNDDDDHDDTEDLDDDDDMPMSNKHRRRSRSRKRRSRSAVYRVNELVEVSYISQISSLVRTPSKFLSVFRSNSANNANSGTNNSAESTPAHGDSGNTNNDVRLGPVTSPLQPVAMASLCFREQIYIFVLSRDCRIRIWNLATRHCTRTIVLSSALAELFRGGVSRSLRTTPSSAFTSSETPSTTSSYLDMNSASTSTTQGMSSTTSSNAANDTLTASGSFHSRNALLPQTLLSALRIFDERVMATDTNNAFNTDHVSFKLACFLPQVVMNGPAAFSVFTGKLDAMGHLVEFDALLARDAGSDGDEFLVDFSVIEGGVGEIGSVSNRRRGKKRGQRRGGDETSGGRDSYGGNDEMMDELDGGGGGRKLARFQSPLSYPDDDDDDEDDVDSEYQDDQLNQGDDNPTNDWWTLWAVWDRSGCSVIRYTQIYAIPDDVSKVEKGKNDTDKSVIPHSGGLITGRRWVMVMTPSLEPPEPPKIDAYNDGFAACTSYAEIYLEHLFEPGRFSPASIVSALVTLGGKSALPAGYDETVSTGLPLHELRSAVISIVRPTNVPRLDENSTSAYFTEYNASLRQAYATFLASVIQHHHAENAPAGIAIDMTSRTIVTVQRGSSIGFLRVADLFETIAWGSTRSMGTPHGAPLLILAPDHLFTGHLTPLRQKSLRADYFHFLRLINMVHSDFITPATSTMIHTDILNSRKLVETAVEDYANGVYVRVMQEMDVELVDERLLALVQRVKSIGDFQYLLASFVDTLRQVGVDPATDEFFSMNGGEGGGDGAGVMESSLTTRHHNRKENNATTFTNTVIASALTQMIHLRFEFVRQTVHSLLILKNLDLGDLNNYEVPSNVLRQYLDLYATYARLKWMSTQHVVETHAVNGGSDADKKIGRGGGFGNGLKSGRSYGETYSSLTSPSTTPASISTPLLLHLLQHHYILDLNVDLPQSGVYGGAPMALFPAVITRAAQEFLDRLGLIGVSGEGLSRAVVDLAQKLLVYGHASLVAELCDSVPRPSPSLVYLRARAWLDTRADYDKAAILFARAAGGGTSPWSTDLHLVLPHASMQMLHHPQDGTDSVDDGGFAEYYYHVMLLFEKRRVLGHALRFAKMAMDALILSSSSTNRSGHRDGETHAMARRALANRLNNAIFNIGIDLGDFDTAFTAIQRASDHGDDDVGGVKSTKGTKTQHDFLGRFVAALCEHGDVHRLCAGYQFGALSTEVERTLEFKARTCDSVALIASVMTDGSHDLKSSISMGPVMKNMLSSKSSTLSSTPIYDRICFAYYAYRGDYRSAAMAMYRLARRLGVGISPTSTTSSTSLSSTLSQHNTVLDTNTHGGTGTITDTLNTSATNAIEQVLPPVQCRYDRVRAVRRLVSEQTKCLLAALQALSLVSREHAWISVMPGPGEVIGRWRGVVGNGFMDEEEDEEDDEEDNDDGEMSDDLDGEDAYTDAAAGDASVSGDMEDVVDRDDMDHGTNRDSGADTLPPMPAPDSKRRQPHIQIVDLHDIRREYHLALAKLHLEDQFPDIALTPALLTPRDALAMYCQAGMVDSALVFAAVFGLDTERVLKAAIDRMDRPVAMTGSTAAAATSSMGFGGRDGGSVSRHGFGMSDLGGDSVGNLSGNNRRWVSDDLDMDEAVSRLNVPPASAPVTSTTNTNTTSSLAGAIGAAHAVFPAPPDASTKWIRLKPVLERLDGLRPVDASPRTHSMHAPHGHQHLRHHLVMVDTILKQNRHDGLPRWLTQPFKTYHTDALIRVYLHHDCVFEAARLAEKYVMGHAHGAVQPMRPVTVSGQWISLTTVEHVLDALTQVSARVSRGVDAAGDRGHPSAVDMAAVADAWAKRLRDAVAVYAARARSDSESLLCDAISSGLGVQYGQMGVAGDTNFSMRFNP